MHPGVSKKPGYCECIPIYIADCKVDAGNMSCLLFCAGFYSSVVISVTS